MMIIWGSASDTKDLGVVETKHCDTCEKERHFKLVLQYRYSHLYYLFTWVSKKNYLLLCDVCHRGWNLDSKKIESTLKKNPISFYRRYSWTFLVGMIGLFVMFAADQGHKKEAQDYSYLRSPQANDLYVAELSKLLKNPEQSPMYGIMWAKSVKASDVTLLISKIGYSKTTSPSKDVDNGKAANSDYYADTALIVSAADLRKMRDDGTIKSVWRK